MKAVPRMVTEHHMSCSWPRPRLLLSRGFTMLVFTAGLRFGSIQALPTWMRILTAHTMTVIASKFVPDAHGKNCRVATMFAASLSLAAHVSPISAAISAAMLWLCPAWALWWPKDAQKVRVQQDIDDSKVQRIEKLFKEVLDWLRDNDGVLPAEIKNPTLAQKPGVSLRLRYRKCYNEHRELIESKKKLIALQKEIDRRQSNWSSTHETIEKLFREVLDWMRDHDDVLPAEHKNPTLAQKPEARLRKAYRICLTEHEDLIAKNKKLNELRKEIERRQREPAPEHDLQVLADIEEWSLANDRKLPQHSTADREQHLLAKKLHKLVTKAAETKRANPLLFARLQALQSKSHNTPTKPAARGGKNKQRTLRSQLLLVALRDEHDEWCVLHQIDPTTRLSPEFQSNAPYPGLINLGNTCYMNAVCQVLLHCGAARRVFQTVSAESAAEDADRVAHEMKRLADYLSHGIPTCYPAEPEPGQPEEVKALDIWSPHALLDAFLAVRPHLQLGQQHDAREVLEEILDRTHLSMLCRTGAAHFQRPDLVALPAFVEQQWWYKDFTSRQQVVDMRALLTNAFHHLPEQLRRAPELLLLTVPQFANDDSDTSLWLNETSTQPPLITADWGDCILQLTQHLHADCANRDQGTYRLVGYVAYIGDDNITPTWSFTSGHFVAYFREGDLWYLANDSLTRPAAMDGQAPPTAFPYICLFERHDQQGCSWKPAKVQTQYTNESELSSSDEEADMGEPSGSEDSEALHPITDTSKSSILSTPQAARVPQNCAQPSPEVPAERNPIPKLMPRLRGKQARPRLCTSDGTPTPKKMKLWQGSRGGQARADRINKRAPDDPEHVHKKRTCQVPDHRVRLEQQDKRHRTDPQDQRGHVPQKRKQPSPELPADTNPTLKLMPRLRGKQAGPRPYTGVNAARDGTPTPKKMNLWHGRRVGQERTGRQDKQDSTDRQDKRDSTGRQQNRTGRQQNRTGRQQNRTGRQDKRDRTGRQQDRTGRQRKEDRTERLKEDLRRMRSRPLANDNQDGTRQDLQANLHNPVAQSQMEHEKREKACMQRFVYGNIFLLLHLMDSGIKVEEAIHNLPNLYFYAGFDCTLRWATYLRDEPRRQTMAARLKEAFGVTEQEIDTCRQKVRSKQWSLAQVAAALEILLLDDVGQAPCSLKDFIYPTTGPCAGPQQETAYPAADVEDTPNPVMTYLNEILHQRLCWTGPPGHSAMPPRLRCQKSWRREPLPILKYPCRMCEAEFPDRNALLQHIDLVHGQYRFYSTFLAGSYSMSAYFVSPTEKRSCIEHCAQIQQEALLIPEDDAAVDLPDEAIQRKQLWSYLCHTCADKSKASQSPANENVGKLCYAQEWADAGTDFSKQPDLQAPLPHKCKTGRCFIACVFCAMLHWSEQLASLHLCGPQCTMKNPAAVADLLCVEWYSADPT